ncbi:MAG: hypothetical protein AUJ82_07345 [Verrucomicrobia bacterium CG1_02_43_26]|nr:MAG: hypothetical protein AUJ82_07345 [Verrucomicrobia bacterium CG1_02_43_26]
MRKIFLVIIILLVFHEVVYAMKVTDLSDGKIHTTGDESDDRPRKKAYESYSDNYQKGFIEGYTYNGGRVRGVDPVPPVAPVARAGETEQDGYTRGILEGRRKKQSGEW